MNYNIILLLLYILCTLQLQLYHKSMASKSSPSTNTFIEGQGTKPQAPHGNSDVATSSVHSYVVPKYVTDVASLITTSAESRNLFLSEITRTCLEAVKKDKADANQAIASQLVQPPTNTNITSTKTIYNTSSYGNPATKPVTPIFNTSGTTIKKIIEDGKPTQAVTLFAPVGIAEDLSRTQYLLCGRHKGRIEGIEAVHC